MGPYCNYCNRRCFVLRVLKTGKSILMATCHLGMINDLVKTGQTHETSVNAITDPEAAARIAAAPEILEPSEFCGFCSHHAEAHSYSASAEDVPCVGCPGDVCPRPDTCQDCLQPIKQVGGWWVVIGTGTSADGLTYCPPDPDATDTGEHRPVITAALAARQAGVPRAASVPLGALLADSALGVAARQAADRLDRGESYAAHGSSPAGRPSTT